MLAGVLGRGAGNAGPVAGGALRFQKKTTAVGLDVGFCEVLWDFMRWEALFCFVLPCFALFSVGYISEGSLH
jgi:hypothetical protein